jgi:hypothetical protein
MTIALTTFAQKDICKCLWANVVWANVVSPHNINPAAGRHACTVYHAHARSILHALHFMSLGSQVKSETAGKMRHDRPTCEYVSLDIRRPQLEPAASKQPPSRIPTK